MRDLNLQPEYASDLARVEAQLRASEARLRGLVQAANDAVIVICTDGLIVDWNPRAVTMFGWRNEEAVGTRLSELIIPQEMRQAHEKGLSEFMKTRRSRIMGRLIDTNALHRDGHVFPVELSVWPIDAGPQLMFGAFVRDVSARHATVRALQEKEEKYRAVVQNASEGLLVVSEGVIVFVNPSTEKILGRSAAELASQPFTHFVHSDDQEMLRQRHMARIRGETVEQHYAIRVLRPDGKRVWVELSAVTLQWKGLPATLSFITDITGRKQLEDNLKQSLLERDTILQNSIVGILFLDQASRVRWANSALGSIFGLDDAGLEALKGRSTAHFYPSANAFRRNAVAVAKTLGAGQAFEREIELCRADGTLFWAYVSGRAVSSTDRLSGSVWAFVDISARRQLEKALRRKTTEQEAILQSALIGICLTRDGNFSWVNQTLSRMFGYESEELVGRPARMLVEADQAWNSVLPVIAEQIDRTGDYRAEHSMPRRDGKSIWVQLQGTRLDMGKGSRVSLWTFVDVTDHHRAEEEIRRALEKEQELSSLKSRFVSMTSHEFRTPLAGILSSVELLQHYTDRLSNEDKVDLFRQIEDSVQRMTRMLDNILLIGRSESSGLRFQPSAENLGSFLRILVEEALASHRGQGERPSIELDNRCRPGVYQFDPTLLRHILGNLLSNAVKYSPLGGKISLRAEPMEDRVRFEVKDEGIGIPLNEQAQLFSNFHRASNVGGIEGTGLGLSIVKQSVEVHGGDITVDSQPGCGTRFVVTLAIPELGEPN